MGIFPFQEEEMPDVEIDIDDLLDAANEEERALKLQVKLLAPIKPEWGSINVSVPNIEKLCGWQSVMMNR
uniref:Uncharacterized protein n=1 Tax=Nothoprocta perdicaria TaxID=30464 RepID=A0A8C6ZVX3_NOTPE